MLPGRTRLVISLASVAAIAVGVLAYRVFFSPQGREAWEHYECVKRETAKGTETHDFIMRSLGQAPVSKEQVRKFLTHNYANLRVFESEGSISAGHLQFSFNEQGNVTNLIEELPCPVF